MEPSVHETTFAARKTGEVCTSVLSGTTAIFFKFFKFLVSALWGRRKTYSHHDLDLVELGLTKFHNRRMQARRELQGPLMEGVLR